MREGWGLASKEVDGQPRLTLPEVTQIFTLLTQLIGKHFHI